MLTAGTRLGSYEIVSSLGAGGMGDVYRARDTKLGREVAIKILPPSFSADPERLARFEREARVLASLNHPNIAQIYGLDRQEAQEGRERPEGTTTFVGSFIVMELVEGETLADRIGTKSRSPIPLAESIAIARQIADALDTAHERGIVHRDLKPANIALTVDGTVKVLDFGLAKASGSGRSSESGGSSWDDISNSPTALPSTMDGMLVGTAPYMSPEQARGKAVDKRTDIWALGCVLYEMLTGRRAFGGETTSDTIAAILEREPDWAALSPTIPARLRRLIERCLVKDPKRRMRDIGDARAELDENSATPGRGADLVSVTRQPRLRLRWLLALTGIAVASGIWAVRLTRSRPDAPRITRAIRITDSPAQEFGPAISPDGKWVAYYSDLRGVSDVWVKFLDSGATSNLTASLDLDLGVGVAISGIDISPDGALIAFTARQRSDATPSFGTWVIPAPIGGQSRKLLTGLQDMHWSPDGKHLVAMRPGAILGDSVIVADADGSNQRTIVPLSGGRHAHWPVWSRDGRFIYFICTFLGYQDEPTEICRVPSVGGPVETVVKTERRAMSPAPAPDGSLLFSANPTTVDAGLWWSPANRGEPVPLTGGVGEYVGTMLSTDGRRAVSTLLDVRQSLVQLSVDRNAVEPRRLTEGYTGDLYPSFDLTKPRMTFSSSRGGSRSVWLARPDASQPSPLTSGTAIDDRPVFSPKGDQIAFVSGRGGRSGIWVVSADGGPARLLGEAIALDTLTWSPDGTRILFSTPSERLAKLVTMSVEDGRIDAFPAPASGHSPAWSPATNRVAYLELKEATATTPSQTTLAIMDHGARRLYPNPGLPLQGFANGFATWSPDGRRLALTASQRNVPVTVWVFDPAAREPFRKLIELPVAVRVRGLTWTPDGSAIVVAEQEEKSDVVLFDLSKGGK